MTSSMIPRQLNSLCLLCLFVFVGTTTGLADEPTAPEGFHAIFNGKDLTGWYGLNPHSVEKLEGEKREANLKQQRDVFAKHWRIENGELVNDGTGPYATTEQEFGNIELRLEYKTVPHADSGIYLRGTPQVQIWDINQLSVPDKPDRNPKFGSGGLFNNTPKSKGRDPLVVADKPFGEWNSFRIRQIGDLTWVWLNDKLVVDGAAMENFWDRSKPLPSKGPIMLQTHGGEIRWRNIFVRELTPEETKPRLEEIGKWVMTYYQQPDPNAFVTRVHQMAQAGVLQGKRPEANELFLAKVMEANPKRVAGWLNSLDNLTPAQQAVVHRAARISQTPEALAWLKEHGKDEILAKPLPPLLVDGPMAFEPYHLDSLWEIFFATGDTKPIRRIVSFFELMPNDPVKGQPPMPPDANAGRFAAANFRIASPAYFSAMSLAKQQKPVLAALQEIERDPEIKPRTKAWLGEAIRSAKGE